MVSATKGWIGVDLDGTLAHYNTGDFARGVVSVGAPVPAMKARVDGWLAEGREVRIFTARIWPIGVVLPDEEIRAVPSDLQNALQHLLEIRRWTHEHFGRYLAVTCMKDLNMVALYDDRCVQVIHNTGELVLPPTTV